MAVSMKGRDIISIHDLTTEEVWEIIRTAEIIKLKKFAGEQFRPLAGKSLAMIFAKPSTRTRISFQVGMNQLGGTAVYLSTNDMQLGRGETIADTARVLSGYVDGIMIRTFDHNDVLELARYASIPVINGLTDLLHPCQVLSDMFTIYEKKQHLAGIKMVYVGDGNNLAHSLMYGAAKVGMHITVVTPEGYEPNEEVVRNAREDAEHTGSTIELAHSPQEAVHDADIIYTDVWTSMGQEKEHDERLRIFKEYQVNSELVSKAKPDVRVMHCLPAHRGEEITDEVADGRHSILFDEAENRLHAQKAILALVM